MVQLEIITGPMFAGKTTMLINKIKNCNLKDNEKILFNYANDKRYSNEAHIASHNKDIVPSIPITNCFEINKYITSSIKAIFIDEIQFLHSLKDWLDNSKQHFSNLESITIAGLNYDIYGNEFNNDFNYLIYTNYQNAKIYHLQSSCYICNEKAYFTILLNNKNNNDIISQNNNVCVGSKDMYQPTCLEHAIKSSYDNNFKRFINKY